MFTQNVILSPKAMSSFIPTYHAHIAHWRQTADNDANLAAILPEKPIENGKPRRFTALQAGLFALVADLVAADFKTPLSAKIARRVMEAHQGAPQVEQWAVVHTANGNLSVLPYTEAQLATGFVSGSRLTFGIVVGLRNYADRVAAAIADAPRMIGGDDGE